MLTTIPSKYSLGELLSGLDEMTVAEREDGFYSQGEWSRMWGVSRDKARQAIYDLVEVGRMEASTRRAHRADGYPYHHPVYRVIEEKIPK